MPGELLRDIRTGEPAGRSPRRWPLIPLSILAHAMVAALIVIVPLTAAVEVPVPAPLPGPRPFLVTAARDITLPAPAPSRTAPAPSTTSAPVTAPPTIGPEVVAPPAVTAGGGVPSIGAGMTAGIGTPVGESLPPPAIRGVAPPAPAPPRPRRVGGEIRAPRRIGGAPPVYPRVAAAARLEGTVILEALIDEQGRVGHLAVFRSHPMFDAAALDAVRSWRYTPTLLNGVPIPVLMTVTVQFSLRR